jgi:hypothetical protein
MKKRKQARKSHTINQQKQQLDGNKNRCDGDYIRFLAMPKCLNVHMLILSHIHIMRR